jgi:hypothetical protein
MNRTDNPEPASEFLTLTQARACFDPPGRGFSPVTLDGGALPGYALRRFATACAGTGGPPRQETA